MPRKELHREPLSGGANTNYFINYEGRVALLRVPKVIHGLTNESKHFYNYVEPEKEVVRVRMRTPQEQYNFSSQAVHAGLPVAQPLLIEKEKIIYPYLTPMRPLSTVIRNDVENVPALLFNLFSDLRRAHRLGFIYGDRNAENILVGQNDNFIHIDFDTEYAGRAARDLEVAKAAYDIIRNGGNSLVPILANTLGILSAQSPKWLNLDTTSQYMRKLAEYFASREMRNWAVEDGVEDRVESIIQGMHVVKNTAKLR